MAEPLELKYRTLQHPPAELHQIHEQNFQEIEDYVNELELRVTELEELDLSELEDAIYDRVIASLFKKFILNTTLLDGEFETVENPNDTENPWTITRTGNKYRISPISNAMHVQIYNIVTLKHELVTTRIDNTFVEVEFDQPIIDNMRVHITSE